MNDLNEDNNSRDPNSVYSKRESMGESNTRSKSAHNTKSESQNTMAGGTNSYMKSLIARSNRGESSSNRKRIKFAPNKGNQDVQP